jgi:uncharacterized protein (TIGR03435 family)
MSGRNLFLLLPTYLALLYLPSVALRAQSPAVPGWQTAAGGTMAFDVASVKTANPHDLHFRPILPTFPLDTGNAKPPGGRFEASFGLTTYITFAYKLRPSPEQHQVLTHLPESVRKDYEIEARAEGNPSKDQMRLMMQSLLADRFKLKVHFETRVVPVFALTLV